MEHSKLPARRRHSDEVKAKVLSECDQASASVAGIALAHNLNANVVHKWRRQARQHQSRGAPQASGENEFIALALPLAQRAAPVIRMELRQGAATMSIRWPVAAAPECAAWLREWLR